MTTTSHSGVEPQGRAPFRLSVDEYRSFRERGFLVVRGLVSGAEVEELRAHTEDLMQGRLPEQGFGATGGVAGARALEAPPAHLSAEEKAQFFLRIHMLHRKLELHERFMLHPRVLDVVEALVGPDVLALQTMLFLKGPGKPGQGWHQDSYYIPTHPDTLVGAWIAIDDVDEYNGAMWFAEGSHVEPVYPPADDRDYGFGQDGLAGVAGVANVSDPDDAANGLSPVADRYSQVLAAMRAGDVAFFGGHVLHRSKRNNTVDRFRRSFVSHYCNARSFTQWGHDAEAAGPDAATGMTNASHILARGDTHLPFARPRFGTPCAAVELSGARRDGRVPARAMMGDLNSGDMGARPADPALEDDD